MTQEAIKSTVTGYIRPIIAENDKELEKNAKISLVTTSGEQYIILPKGAGNDLLERLNANITATGNIFNENERSYFFVRDYSFNDDLEHEWYNDEY
ncbi:hypothetical protein [Desulfovibrio litoralis]|uniref:Uncharacterized protein n=1 Tax=Desulfovibrio litoralis DSM 11393 TaxID=1121455 RepID=A0A1M7RS09_9BACT|nr:hypothetical protein [Desulfovibrio litoralis]SHN48912.1 hypothetical protein SAMN02745728_00070 [Desulfovibrio litoralis DSM 11393]